MPRVYSIEYRRQMATNNVEAFEWACARTKFLYDFITKEMAAKWIGWEFMQALPAPSPGGSPEIYIILRRPKK